VNRGLRAAAMGVLLLSPIALAACSAGQVAQTATQEQNLGNSADVGQLHLRALELPYPTGGEYTSGANARLLGAIASDATTDDTLVSIEGAAFSSVEIVDPSASSTAGTGSSSGSGSGLTIPAGGTLFIGNGNGPSVTLVGFSAPVGVGQYVDVTFTFQQAGAVTVSIPVATAARDLPRGEPFDFHGGESSAEGGGA
jgi:copper(I)-binding protein